MSDTSKRIWAWTREWGKAVEYVRADLTDPMSDERVQALVKALEEYATHRKSGRPWNPSMPKVYTTLAALQEEKK